MKGWASLGAEAGEEDWSKPHSAQRNV
jgi:hypothetical protein